MISTSVPDGEVIKEYQRVTAHQHKGVVLVQTVELGIGQYPEVTYNNFKIASPRKSVLLCQDERGGIEPCKPGGRVAGYARTWTVSGYGVGEFVYRLTSVNHPFNTETTRLSIR